MISAMQKMIMDRLEHAESVLRSKGYVTVVSPISCRPSGSIVRAVMEGQAPMIAWPSPEAAPEYFNPSLTALNELKASGMNVNFCFVVTLIAVLAGTVGSPASIAMACGGNDSRWLCCAFRWK